MNDSEPAYGELKYRRVLLKLSGEALLGTDRPFGIDEGVLRRYAAELKRANADLAEAKKSGNVLKRLGASVRAATAFLGLYTIPSKTNRVPETTRLEPAY